MVLLALNRTGQKSNQTHHPLHQPQPQPVFLTLKKKNNKIRSFFKTILPSTIRDLRIEIPRTFVKNFGKEMSDVADVKVPSGRVWNIGLKKTDGEVWIQNGLREFVEYYAIRAGHSLVFRYDGNSQFYVLIYDSNASEIDYSGNSNRLGESNHDLGCIVPKQNEGKEDLVEIEDVSRSYTPAPVEETIDEVQATKGMGGNPPVLQRSVEKRSLSTCEFETRCNKKRMPNHDIASPVPEQNEVEEDLSEMSNVIPCQSLAPVMEITDEVQRMKGTGNPPESQHPIRLTGKSDSVKKISLPTCETETRWKKERTPNRDLRCRVLEQNESEEDSVGILDVLPWPVGYQVPKTNTLDNPQVMQRPFGLTGQSSLVDRSRPICGMGTGYNKMSIPNHEAEAKHNDGYERQTTKGMGTPPISRQSNRSPNQIDRSRPICEMEAESNKMSIPNHEAEAKHNDGYERQTTKRMGTPPISRQSNRSPNQTNSVMKTHSVCESETRFIKRTNGSFGTLIFRNKFNSNVGKEFKRDKQIQPANDAVESRELSPASERGGYQFKQDVHAARQGGNVHVPERPPNLCPLALLRTSISSKENYRVLEEAKAFKSENPFFIINMQRTYVRKSLNIPFHFMNAYFGDQDRDVILRVSNGRAWRVRCRMYNGISKLYAGWLAFSKGNNLQVGDVCVFELIKKEGAVLNVSIFRV